MRHKNLRKNEQGMALILSLLALLLITAVGLGMIYMSNTESSINTNYKDTQVAFFAMRAGLEEGRDRLRANSTPPTIPLPVLMPPAVGSIVYILNPAGATDPVTPGTFGSKYFDDEFCHESFLGAGVTYAAPGTPCAPSGAPPAVSIVTMASASPNTNSAAALKYKWVRITLKENETTGTPGILNANTWVNPGQAPDSQVCWDATLLKERVSSEMVPGAKFCSVAKNAGFNVQPVYLITSLAVTPAGSRRVGQYEAGAYMITPPVAGLALDGPAATFNKAPNSNNFGISGYNSGSPSNTVAPNNTYTPWTGPGGQAACTSPTPAVVPAIAVGDAQGVTNMDADIPNNRQGNYTGSTPLAPAPLVPSVQNEGTGTAQYPSTNSLAPGSNWSTPFQLNQLAQAMANMANNTYNCSLNGLPVGAPSCSGTYGTDASPKITYINGDATVSGGAGVLVVTGTLSMNGNINFDGLILVIGQGIMNVKGGGGGQINGEVLIANTNSQTAPYAQLPTLGSPTINWNGGGSNFIQYNSCWADYGSYMQYALVASREEMY